MPAREDLEAASVITAAVNLLSREVQRQPSVSTDRPSRAAIPWMTPPEGVLKVNADGAFVQCSKQGGWGFGFRDHTGDPVLIVAGNLAGVQDTLMAEAFACLKALEEAVAHGISRLQLETDSTYFAPKCGGVIVAGPILTRGNLQRYSCLSKRDFFSF